MGSLAPHGVFQHHQISCTPASLWCRVKQPDSQGMEKLPVSALAATRAVSVSLWLRAPGFSAQAFAEQPSAWKRNRPPYHQPACLCSATTFPSNRSAPGAGREAQLLLHWENQEEKQGTRGKDTQKFRLHIEPGKKARLQLRFHLKLGTVKGAVQGRSPGSAARQSNTAVPECKPQK